MFNNEEHWKYSDAFEIQKFHQIRIKFFLSECHHSGLKTSDLEIILLTY